MRALPYQRHDASDRDTRISNFISGRAEVDGSFPIKSQSTPSKLRDMNDEQDILKFAEFDREAWLSLVHLGASVPSRIPFLITACGEEG